MTRFNTVRAPTSRPIRIWQTSLRTLILFMLVTGTVAGFYGPDIARVIREWKGFSREPNLQIICDYPLPPAVQMPPEMESNGYFESAETPLR